MFTVVFFVMVAVVPLFGWLATRFNARRWCRGVQLLHRNLLLFWLLFRPTRQPPAGGAFFVWVSVFACSRCRCSGA
jgi:AAA family ATP:ADP antiporter